MTPPFGQSVLGGRRVPADAAAQRGSTPEAALSGSSHHERQLVAPDELGGDVGHGDQHQRQRQGERDERPQGRDIAAAYDGPRRREHDRSRAIGPRRYTWC